MQQRDLEETEGRDEVEFEGTEAEAAMALITQAPEPRDLEGLDFEGFVLSLLHTKNNHMKQLTCEIGTPSWLRPTNFSSRL